MSAKPETSKEGTVDDRGTTQGEGRELLRQLRDEAFQGDDEKLALVLGRPVDEVKGMIDLGAEVDDDVVMKARGIAKERRVE